MTDEAKLSRERIEEIRRGCEGVTPGPWYQTGSPWFHSGDGVLAGSPDGNIAYLIADCDDGMNPRDEYTEGGGPFPLGDKDADAAHIARLDPATVRALCTLALKGLDAGEGKPVAWLHPISGWANEDREFVAVHCQKDGPQPIPLYARPSPADGAVEALKAELGKWFNGLPCGNGIGKEHFDALLAIVSRLPASAGVTPEGWVATPEEPTAEMRIAGAKVHDQRPSEAAAVFAAMLAARPAPPVEG